MNKNFAPILFVIVLILASLACNDGPTVIDTANNVSSTSQQTQQTLDGDILNDANQALKDTLSDLQQLNCDIDNTSVGCPDYVAPQPIQ